MPQSGPPIIPPLLCLHKAFPNWAQHGELLLDWPVPTPTARLCGCVAQVAMLVCSLQPADPRSGQLGRKAWWCRQDGGFHADSPHRLWLAQPALCPSYPPSIAPLLHPASLNHLTSSLCCTSALSPTLDRDRHSLACRHDSPTCCSPLLPSPPIQQPPSCASARSWSHSAPQEREGRIATRSLRFYLSILIVTTCRR